MISMLTKNNYGTMLLLFCLAIFAIVPSQQNEDGAEVYIGSCKAFGLSFDECDFECKYQNYIKGHCKGFFMTKKFNGGKMVLFVCLTILTIVSSQNYGLDVKIGNCKIFGQNFDECNWACLTLGYWNGHCEGFLYTACWCKVQYLDVSLPIRTPVFSLSPEIVENTCDHLQTKPASTIVDLLIDENNSFNFEAMMNRLPEEILNSSDLTDDYWQIVKDYSEKKGKSPADTAKIIQQCIDSEINGENDDDFAED
ncbi:hypothetical protein KQX54_017521 [Cotesia glomerata]|uniref:Uncharacterized protein n=1 Tax=Cotesia glomerata TaxID=32391 RepID=A0AAV7HWP4_COTGL|nr:hypothetical protein KQX54_017521 [Cotesia glomerata]